MDPHRKFYSTFLKDWNISIEKYAKLFFERVAFEMNF